jgi:hypothetical protein
MVPLLFYEIGIVHIVGGIPRLCIDRSFVLPVLVLPAVWLTNVKGSYSLHLLPSCFFRFHSFHLV